jgi:hypothetical protein
MSLIIKEVQGQKRVYNNRKLVGTLRKFCCGIDFRPHGKPNALFSILRVKFGEQKLIKCVEALLTVEIPNKKFHWNFSYGTASNDCKFAAFKNCLKNLENPS